MHIKTIRKYGLLLVLILVLLMTGKRVEAEQGIYLVIGNVRAEIKEGDASSRTSTTQSYQILAYYDETGVAYEFPMAFERVDKYELNEFDDYICTLYSKGNIPFLAANKKTGMEKIIRPHSVTFLCVGPD